jgi:potassium-transporting ATPase KdpC subunit
MRIMSNTVVRPLLSLFIGLSIITGLAYPALITGIAQTLWPFQANGSLIERDGRPQGSLLIGRSVTDARDFRGRPSATADKPYNPLASGGSNLGTNNPALIQAVRERAAAWRASNPSQKEPIPIDLLTASASGLDPEISLAAVLWQVPRVAHARGLPPDEVSALVKRTAVMPASRLLGPARVNVGLLNEALASAYPTDRLSR